MSSLPQPWIRTPLIESAPLSKAAGCRIFLKLENLQPSGSFKTRGLGNLIRTSLESRLSQKSVSQESPNITDDSNPSAVNGANGTHTVQSDDTTKPRVHYYCSSGGNAGLGAVGAALSLGQECTVVVPMSTKPVMIARIRAAGATDVIQKGATWRDADNYLQHELLTQPAPPGVSRVYVPPFDHELVYAGNASMVTEIAEDLPPSSDLEPDALICSVGGGGLFSGVADGVKTQYASRPTMIAVETKGCDSLNQSIQAGKLITLDGITSLATSLGATRVSQHTLDWGLHPKSKSVVVTDADAAMGCRRFADDHRMLVELACGASLCLVYNGMLSRLVPDFSPQSKVVVVVCGGTNVSLDMLAEYKVMFGEEMEEAEKKATSDVSVPSTHTAPN